MVYEDIDSESRVGKDYYWIQAVDNDSGKLIVLGAYDSEEAANRVGFEKVKGSFEVIALPTRDQTKATRMLKYRRFDQTSRLNEIARRAKHQ